MKAAVDSKDGVKGVSGRYSRCRPGAKAAQVRTDQILIVITKELSPS